MLLFCPQCGSTVHHWKLLSLKKMRRLLYTMLFPNTNLLVVENLILGVYMDTCMEHTYIPTELFCYAHVY